MHYTCRNRPGHSGDGALGAGRLFVDSVRGLARGPTSL